MSRKAFQNIFYEFDPKKRWQVGDDPLVDVYFEKGSSTLGSITILSQIGKVVVSLKLSKKRSCLEKKLVAMHQQKWAANWKGWKAVILNINLNSCLVNVRTYR